MREEFSSRCKGSITERVMVCPVSLEAVVAKSSKVGAVLAVTPVSIQGPGIKLRLWA